MATVVVKGLRSACDFQFSTDKNCLHSLRWLSCLDCTLWNVSAWQSASVEPGRRLSDVAIDQHADRRRQHFCRSAWTWFCWHSGCLPYHQSPVLNFINWYTKHDDVLQCCYGVLSSSSRVLNRAADNYQPQSVSSVDKCLRCDGCLSLYGGCCCHSRRSCLMASCA